MTEREKMMAGLLYDANYNEELLEERIKAKEKCFDLNQLRPSQKEERESLLHTLLGKCGENPCVISPFWCDAGYNIEVGDYFFSNHNLVILDAAKVKFGNHVFIGPNCTFSTAGHALDVEQRNQGLEFAYPITVGDDVWFGAGVTVLPGVTIGSGTVIGAGSVVNRDIPSGVVAVGNPCRVLRTITEEDKKKYPCVPAGE